MGKNLYRVCNTKDDMIWASEQLHTYFQRGIRFIQFVFKFSSALKWQLCLVTIFTLGKWGFYLFFGVFVVFFFLLK